MSIMGGNTKWGKISKKHLRWNFGKWQKVMFSNECKIVTFYKIRKKWQKRRKDKICKKREIWNNQNGENAKHPPNKKLKKTKVLSQ